MSRTLLPASLRVLPIALLLILGAACAPDESAAMRAHELSLALWDTRALSAWHGGAGRESSIYVQPLDPLGRLEGAPIRVSDGPDAAFEPDLVAGESGMAIAWYQRARRSGDLSAWLAGLLPGGERQWIVPLTAGGEQARNPVVRFIDETLHVAWIEQGRSSEEGAAIWYQRFSSAGEALAPPLQAAWASRETWNLNAGVYDGTFFIVYDAALGTQTHELHMLAIRGGTTRHLVLSEDDGHASLYPDLQFSASGRAALTWFDERDGNQEVYLLTMDADVLGSTGTAAARRISYTPEESIGAYLAWNGEVIGLAWSDLSGGRRDIFTQHFGADGRELGPVYRVSSSAWQAGVPVVRAHDDGFLIGWNDYRLAGDRAHMNVVTSRARFAQVPLIR